MSSSIMGMAGFWLRVTPVTPFDGELVGFGRAVSDSGLTASIYDVMVTLASKTLKKNMKISMCPFRVCFLEKFTN